MTDPVPDSKPSSRWFWVGAIALLAVAAVIFFLNADGDEDLETIPDEAITTTEERLNTDFGTEPTAEELDQVMGGAETGETGEGTEPEEDIETMVDPTAPAEQSE